VEKHRTERESHRKCSPATPWLGEHCPFDDEFDLTPAVAIEPRDYQQDGLAAQPEQRPAWECCPPDWEQQDVFSRPSYH